MASGKWVLAKGAAELKRRFLQGWRSRPEGALKRWFLVIVLGWLLGAALAAALSLIGRSLAAAGMAQWDRYHLLEIATNEQFSFQTAIFFEGIGGSAMIVPIVVVAMVIAVWSYRWLTALTIAVGYVLHDPLVWIGWMVWDRARPDLVAGGIAAPPLHSYPSGHAVQIISVYGVLAYLWVRRSDSLAERLLAFGLVGVAAAVVCYSRLRLGVHWPSDIFAGAVLGSFWLGVCILALKFSDVEHASPP